MKTAYGIAFFLMSLMLLFNACQSSNASPQQKKVIDIKDVEVKFPDLPGYTEFKAGCITCHSLRYIEMQPDFPERPGTRLLKR